jgi:hypothetical protein
MFLKARGRKPKRLLWDTKNLKSKIIMKSQNMTTNLKNKDGKLKLVFMFGVYTKICILKRIITRVIKFGKFIYMSKANHTYEKVKMFGVMIVANMVFY